MADTAHTGSSTPAGAVDDDELLRRLRAGDDDAFERLVRLFGGRMLAVARRFLRNEEDARDTVQDAFLSAFRALDRFEGNSRLSTWLQRITINAALMKIRSRSRKPDTSIDALLSRFRDDGHAETAPARWRGGLDGLMQQQETRELVRRRIDELPDDYRTVLMLRDIDQFDTESTAQVLGITPGAVKTRLHRARQALRTLLEEHFRGDAA